MLVRVATWPNAGDCRCAVNFLSWAARGGLDDKDDDDDDGDDGDNDDDNDNDAVVVAVGCAAGVGCEDVNAASCNIAAGECESEFECFVWMNEETSLPALAPRCCSHNTLA